MYVLYMQLLRKSLKEDFYDPTRIMLKSQNHSEWWMHLMQLQKKVEALERQFKASNLSAPEELFLQDPNVRFS